MWAVVLWGYLAAVNLVAALVTAWDKRCARRGNRRVPETRLWLFAALGGALAMLCVMRRIRHKTRHRSFMWGLPALLVLQIAGTITIFTFLS